MNKSNIFINTHFSSISELKNNHDLIAFYIGLFLLPSALPISLLFILYSTIFSILKNKEDFINDKINIFFLFACFMLLISTFTHYFGYFDLNYKSNWDPSLSLIGLANWIPLIVLFIGSQKYLKTTELRKIFVMVLLSGSIPVLFSCFSQYFLKWYGPYEYMNGLIIWYQRPLSNFLGVTGLFSNQNYTASWLNIIWPFAIVYFISIKKNFIKKIFSFLILLAIFIFIILTGSRAGWLGMICAFPLVFGSKSIKWFFPSIIFFLSFIAAIIFPIFGKTSQNFLQTYIPKFLWINFSSITYEGWDTSRIEIWVAALKGIRDNFFFGNGATSFPYFFQYETSFWKGHTHNLPLELSFSYGVPVALIILGTITFIIYKGFKNQYLNKKTILKENIYEKAWFGSLLILILGHMVDIQYFDARISIIGWLLLAGLKNILNYDL
tara:strand:+ start:710 stop:2023 length:1314 start_codon:yes stop_codon:yes gene_type:complete